jgi:hypothetical protein
MNKVTLHKIIGSLVEHGHYELADLIVARSPLSNVPKPKRKESTYQEKDEKRQREHERYHKMSPHKKREKAKNTKKRREKREIVARLISGNYS